MNVFRKFVYEGMPVRPLAPPVSVKPRTLSMFCMTTRMISAKPSVMIAR